MILMMPTHTDDDDEDPFHFAALDLDNQPRPQQLQAPTHSVDTSQPPSQQNEARAAPQVGGLESSVKIKWKIKCS